MKQSEIQTNNYTPRTERKDGKTYLVVPVVMMREGVHSGSHGAIYHTAEELGKDIEKWNGIPITINHPQEGDTFISANSPGVQVVGRIYNAHMDGDKLKAEAWLNEQKMLSASPQALEHIRAMRPLDVSVGIYSEELAVAGDWNGEHYNAQAANYRPDHLALLPGGEGACSWADGCGIRANEKTDNMETINIYRLTGEKAGLVMTNQQQGYIEIIEQLQAKLNGFDNEARVYYLTQVYEDYFIYRVMNRQDGTEKFYKQEYTAGEQLEFKGEPLAVKREVTYKELTPQNNQDINKQTNKMEKTPCCPELLAKVIQSNHRLSEADKKWLSTLETPQLEKLLPEITEEQVTGYIAGLEENKVINLLPEALQVNVKLAIEARDKLRSDKITEIMTNSGDIWTKEDLEAMPCATLDKISKSLQPGNYAAAGGNKTPETKGEAPLLPPQVK
jgi:hypothetical protein